MIKLNCPLCGSPVKAQNATPHSRLTCKKCHTPFHLNRAGVPVVGEPPDVENDVEALKQKARESIEKVPVKKIAVWTTAALVVGLTVYYLTRPVDRLKPTAERAARALADGDLDYLKSIASPETADDVARWYDEAHAQLVKQREKWAGRDEVVDVAVAKEDPVGRQGSVAIAIRPVAGNARDVTLADPGAATAGALSSVELPMEWTLSKRGHWELNGLQTYAKIHPPASTTSSK